MPNSQIILYDCMHNFHTAVAVCPFYLLLSQTASVDHFLCQSMDVLTEIRQFIDP